MAGNDGLHHAGYKQISKSVDADFIGPSTKSTAATTCPTAAGWVDVEILSTDAQFAAITAPGLVGSSNITSETTFAKYWTLSCSKITAIKFTSETSGFMAICHRRVLI